MVWPGDSLVDWTNEMVKTSFDTATVLVCVGECNGNLVIVGRSCFFDPGPLVYGEELKVALVMVVCTSCEVVLKEDGLRGDLVSDRMKIVAGWAVEYLERPVVFGFTLEDDGRSEILVLKNESKTTSRRGDVRMVASASIAAWYQEPAVFMCLTDKGLKNVSVSHIVRFIPVVSPVGDNEKDVIRK